MSDLGHVPKTDESSNSWNAAANVGSTASAIPCADQGMHNRSSVALGCLALVSGLLRHRWLDQSGSFT